MQNLRKSFLLCSLFINQITAPPTEVIPDTSDVTFEDRVTPGKVIYVTQTQDGRRIEETRNVEVDAKTGVQKLTKQISTRYPDGTRSEKQVVVGNDARGDFRSVDARVEVKNAVNNAQNIVKRAGLKIEEGVSKRFTRGETEQKAPSKQADQAVTFAEGVEQDSTAPKMHVTRYFNTQTTIDENHFGDLGRKPAVEAKQDAEQQDNTAQSKNPSTPWNAAKKNATSAASAVGNAVVGGAKAVGNLFIAAQSAIAKGVANMAGRDQTDKQTFFEHVSDAD